jgi:ketosteroid isomerase-like protein
MTDAALHALLDSYFAGLDAEDWDGLEALFAPAAELIAPGAHRHGARAVARYFRDALAPYPDHHDEPGRRLLSASAASVEIHFRGHLASGAAIEFDAVDVFDVRDGRIARLTSWYDSDGVRRALLAGLAREEGADGAAAALALAQRSLRGRPAQELGGRWIGEVPPALSLPATVIDVAGELRAAQLPGALRGRALMLRGATGCDPEFVAGAAAVVSDSAAPLGRAPLRGVEFDLSALAAGEGVLVSAPSADGAAHAVLLR